MAAAAASTPLLSSGTQTGSPRAAWVLGKSNFSLLRLPHDLDFEEACEGERGGVEVAGRSLLTFEENAQGVRNVLSNFLSSRTLAILREDLAINPTREQKDVLDLLSKFSPGARDGVTGGSRTSFTLTDEETPGRGHRRRDTCRRFRDSPERGRPRKDEKTPLVQSGTKSSAQNVSWATIHALKELEVDEDLFALLSSNRQELEGFLLGDLTISDDADLEALSRSSMADRLVHICHSAYTAGSMDLMHKLRWLFLLLMVGDMQRALFGSRGIVKYCSRTERSGSAGKTVLGSGKPGYHIRPLELQGYD
ncbi:hypothetical protein BDR22DRAFT_827310 [Usnea florida]